MSLKRPRTKEEEKLANITSSDPGYDDYEDWESDDETVEEPPAKDAEEKDETLEVMQGMIAANQFKK